MRCFSTVHDSYNKSLGRASYNKAKTKKSGLQHDEHCMPPVSDFASGMFHERWYSVLPSLDATISCRIKKSGRRRDSTDNCPRLDS